jgi:putative endopeptidase
MAHGAGTWGISLTDRDPSIKPGDDFFMYQNGGWFARTELSPQVPYAAYCNDLRKLSPRRLIVILNGSSGRREPLTRKPSR